jgi:hypothetical protein
MIPGTITRHMTTLDELKAQAKSSPALREAIAVLFDEKNVAQVPKGIIYKYLLTSIIRL